jgi:hypothetical protein
MRNQLQNKRLPYSLLKVDHVKTLEDGYDQGSDYKFEIGLEEGYCFANGRNAGSGYSFFNTVAEFKHACPIIAKSEFERQNS